MALKNKLRYKFDNFMSRGPKAMFAALFITSFISIIIGAVLVLFLTRSSGGPKDFWNSLWWSLLHTTDPGTFAAPQYEPSKSPLVYKIISVIVTFSGILFFSLLIAFLNTFFQQKLEDLQKGKSNVVEKDFTLILGWNDKIFDIIEELVIANENQKKPAIVILANKDKVEMDEILLNEISSKKNTRLITRSGEPSSFQGLNKVNFLNSKSIIILASTNVGATKEEKISSDSSIIKILLAILYHPNRADETLNVVTEIYDEKNIDVIKSFGGDNVTIVNSSDIIAKVMTQTSRQTGLPIVYEELLSFDGCEIYINNYPKVYNRKFENIYKNFPGGYPIGIQRNDLDILINPNGEEILKEGDKLIVIAEDDDTCIYKDKLLCEYKLINDNPKELSGDINSEKVLILGFNEKIVNIIKEFEEYTTFGSEVTIVFPFDEKTKEVLKKKLSSLSKIKVKIVSNDYTDREILYQLNPFQNDIIFVLSRDMEVSSMEKSDADTIFTLLVLREIKTNLKNGKNTKIVSEILDIKNKELIESTSVNDFIISYKLISMVLAQISEQKNMSKVYDHLFSEEGSEIYLKSASKYFDNLPIKLNFYQIMDQVFKRNEIAFGYKLKKYENNKAMNYGVKLNPEKNQIIEITKDDSIIVIAEDER